MQRGREGVMYKAKMYVMMGKSRDFHHNLRSREKEKERERMRERERCR